MLCHWTRPHLPQLLADWLFVECSSCLVGSQHRICSDQQCCNAVPIRARATVLRCLGETMELVADVSIGEEPTFSQVMLADGTQTEW